MTSEVNIGIIGLGVYLPETIRTNDWWPAHVVASWPSRRSDAHLLGPEPQAKTGSPGCVLVERALAEHASDPFQGTCARRVLASDRPCSDMEVRACQAAIAHAGVGPRDIDFVLGFSMIPDHLTVANACLIHERLGLRSRCLTLGTDASFNAFASQLTLARALIASGVYRCGLLFQSNALGRLICDKKPYAPWFGDAATAVVVGPVSRDRGLLAASHVTDGSLFDAMVAGVPEQRWYDEGRVQWYPGVARGPASLLLGVADRARDVIGAALARASVPAGQVDFYAAHQPSVWFRQVTQEYAGLRGARSVDTFPWAASVGACNVPLVLHTALDSGLLHDGDRVVTYTGGLGATWSAMVLRWGA